MRTRLWPVLRTPEKHKVTLMQDADAAHATVLIVDDEPGIRDLAAAWLGGTYEVRTAADGTDALEVVDGDVDLAFLDRRMPGKTGDEVLETLRDRGYTFPVAMLTAVSPTLDILEMSFDDYVVKPVSREELLDVAERLERRATYDERSREFFRLATKRAKLEAEESVDHRESEEYHALVSEMEELQAELNEVLDELSSDDLESVFRQI
ncbi:MAG: response regulator [Halodesulfurarchaeum sp.]